MKIKYLFIIILLFSLIGCVSFDQKALKKGYIKAENCPKQTVPERQPLPHPVLSTVDIQSAFIFDNEGNIVGLNEHELMVAYAELFGGIEKFKVLVEIYEREYLNAGGKIEPDLTLEELKEKYRRQIGIIDEIIPEATEDKYNTGVHYMTIEEFYNLLDLKDK